MVPGTLPLSGPRTTAFDEILIFRGADLTGADMRMQVRLTPNTPGAPLIDLTTVTTTNTQGLRLIDVVHEDGIPISRVRIHINKPTMAAMPSGTPIEDDALFAWDMLIDPEAERNPWTGIQQRYLKGPFTVESGVTLV